MMIKGLFGAVLAALAGFAVGLALIAATAPVLAQAYQPSFNCEAMHHSCLRQAEKQNPGDDPCSAYSRCQSAKMCEQARCICNRSGGSEDPAPDRGGDGHVQPRDQPAWPQFLRPLRQGPARTGTTSSMQNPTRRRTATRQPRPSRSRACRPFRCRRISSRDSVRRIWRADRRPQPGECGGRTVRGSFLGCPGKTAVNRPIRSRNSDGRSAVNTTDGTQKPYNLWGNVIL